MRRTTSLVAITLAVALGAPPSGAAGPAPAPSKYGTAKNFKVVGATTLGNRGVNSPVGVAGACVYVGDRYDKNGVAIVDVRNPARPKQVGTIPPLAGSTQRELRADDALNLLVVMSYALSLPAPVGANALRIYDIKDCTKPRLLGTYDFGQRSPHEFFLWKDAKRPGRVLVYTAMTIFAPDLEVVDISVPTLPRPVGAFDVVADHAQEPMTGLTTSDGGYLHSVAVSDDGTRAYMGTWDYGFYVLDTSQIADPPAGDTGAPVVRPVGLTPVTYPGNVHGAVRVPGRPYAVLVSEAYADPGAGGCPFGWLRIADVSNEAAPKLTGGEFKLRENDCKTAEKLNGTFTSHNQTVFPNIALVPWYGGGLRAVDISNPKRPVEAGAFVPKPTFEPIRRDPRLDFPNSDAPVWTGSMWSYPVVQNGLIYVVDIDLGLFILRYTGPRASEISKAGFVEGNSAPSRYTRVPRLSPDAERPLVAEPGYVRSPWSRQPVPAEVIERYRSGPNFFCVGLGK